MLESIQFNFLTFNGDFVYIKDLLIHISNILICNLRLISPEGVTYDIII